MPQFPGRRPARVIRHLKLRMTYPPSAVKRVLANDITAGRYDRALAADLCTDLVREVRANIALVHHAQPVDSGRGRA